MNACHLSAVLLLAAATPSAFAQTSANDEQPDIIVSGLKLSRPLQQTLPSVSVTTDRKITDQNLINVYDILEQTPNITIDSNRSSFSIRGIDAFDVSGGGDGALASVYLDGAFLPQKALSAGPLDLFDIAQVEVYRGPQSTIQGRNALAGAVIIRSADPTLEWSGRARMLMSDKDGQRRAAAAVGGPLIDDQLAFRLAGEIVRAEGLIRNVTTHKDADRRRSETVRGKMLLTPSALPGLRILASFMHDRHRRGTFYTEFDAPFRPTDRLTAEDVMGRQEVEGDIGTLEVSYPIASGIDLHSVTNLGNFRSTTISDPDRGPSSGQASRIDDPSRIFQQELRLNIDAGWVQGVVGAYYLRDDNRGYFFDSTQELNLVRLGVDRQLLALGLSAPIVGAVLNLYGGVVPIRNTLAQPRLTTNRALFTDLTFPLTTRLRLHAGLRFDHERQERSATQLVEITGDLPDPATVPFVALRPIIAQLNGLLQATAADANSVEPTRTIAYHAWLPKAGISYDVAREVTLGFTAQRGYRAGGAGLNQQRATPYEYEPEYTWNYELSMRSQWLDRRLTLNANAYWIDWKDQQISLQLTPGAVFDRQVVNAGKSRLYGFEVELSGRPVDHLQVYSGFGYSNTEFQHFNVPAGVLFQGAAEGNEFALAPRWTASAGATYRHPTGMMLDINANYRSSYFQDAVNQAARDIRGRTLMNAKLGWQGQHLGAFVTARNIFNIQKKTQFFTDFDGRTRGMVNPPRIISIGFEGRF